MKPIMKPISRLLRRLRAVGVACRWCSSTRGVGAAGQCLSCGGLRPPPVESDEPAEAPAADRVPE